MRDSAISIPFGWYEKYLPWNQNGVPTWRIILDIVIWIAGFGVTALAATLGAPFWFEILQKVAKIRSSGIATGREDREKRPRESKPEATAREAAAGPRI